MEGEQAIQWKQTWAYWLRLMSKSGVHNSFVGYAFYSGFPSAFLVLLSLTIALAYSWKHRATQYFHRSSDQLSLWF